MPELSSVSVVYKKPSSIDRSIRIGIVGDSISQPQNYGGWAELGILKTNGRLVFVKNIAVSGYSLKNMSDNFTLLSSDNIDEVWIQGGTNSPGITADNILYLESLVSKIRAIQATPIIHCIPPSNLNSATNTLCMAWNEYLYRFCEKNNITLRNYWGHVVDSAIGGMLSSVTSDGVHPNHSTHDVISNSIGSIYGSDRKFMPFSNSCGGLSANVLNLLDSNADGVADELLASSASGTLVKSLVVGYSDFVGKAQKLSFSANDSSGYFGIAKEVAGVVSGGRYISKFKLDIPQVIDGRLQILTYWYSGSTQVSSAFITRYSPPKNNGSMVIDLGQAPETANKVRVAVNVLANSAFSSVDMYFGECDFYLVD